MLCQKENIREIIETLLKVHPYEEPAYEVYKIFELMLNSYMIKINCKMQVNG